MIAYEELAAALERWRIRNGLPATPPLFADSRGVSAPPAAPRSTQAIAAAPPPPAVVVAPPPVVVAPPAVVVAPPAPARGPAPPPPPSGRTTLFGMPAPTVPAAAPATAAMEAVPAPPEDEVGDLGEADVLEESGDPYDNEGNDYAVSFGSTAAGALGDDGGDTRVSGDAGSSADGWPEARTVMSHGWGQPAAARTVEVDEADEATQIGAPVRRE